MAIPMQNSKHNRLASLTAIIITVLGTVFPNASSAATRTVTSSLDTGAAGTLRAEIAAAASGDTVQFASNLNGKTITLKLGQLVVDKSLTIAGPGVRNLTVSGNNKFRVFYVGGPGSSAGSAVTISGLAITKGNGVGADLSGSGNGLNGGGLHNVGFLKLIRCAITSSKALGSGGGIYNRGTLNEVTECTIAYNTAVANGGGVFDEQDMKIQRCAIYNNTAGGDGGGIQEGGTSVLINTTIACNMAAGYGGGLNDAGGATIDLYNCTISGNTASIGGGLAVPFFGASTTLRNTIVAGNNPSGPPTPAPDVSDIFIDGTSGILISAGNNLIGTTTGAGPGSFLPSDLLNANPKLGALKDNGGPTLTMALLPGSPAIDAGNNANVLASMTTDQRTYIARIIKASAVNPATVDIGAYEYVESRDLKFDAVDLLTPLLPNKRVANAIYYLNKSLNPTLWVDDTHLTMCGEDVFEYEEKAAKQLIYNCQYAGALSDAAINALDAMVTADEQLARAAIDEAVTAHGRAQDISRANSDLLKALGALSKQDYVGAIGFYEEAWKDAQKAMGRRCGHTHDCGHHCGHNGDDDDDGDHHSHGDHDD